MHQGETYTAKEYAAKVEWSARQIVRLDADIIGFQEIWHRDSLVDVFGQAGLADQYELITCDKAGMAVGLAVRCPMQIQHTAWIWHFPPNLVLRKRPPFEPGQPDYCLQMDIDRFSRPVLHVEVRPYAGHDIAVYVGHLKSKLGIRLDVDELDSIKAEAAVIGRAMAGLRRTAEAAALRIMINDRMRASAIPVVLMGDFNDEPRSDAMEILSGTAPYQLHSVAELPRVSGGLQQPVYTHLHDGQPLALDYIFVSEHFSPVSAMRQWMFDGVRIYSDHLAGNNTASSDHGLLRANFHYQPLIR